MVEQADVVIENMTPGTFARLGFDYDSLRAINPRIIFAQIKGFSPDSPQADYLPFDMIAQPTGGTIYPGLSCCKAATLDQRAALKFRMIGKVP